MRTQRAEAQRRGKTRAENKTGQLQVQFNLCRCFEVRCHQIGACCLRCRSQTLKGFVPAVYTAERNDTLPKIAKQQGIDLNTLCQINGLSRNSRLKPGQKIQLSTQDASERTPASSKAENTSVRSASKRSTSARSTLQANMKPAADSKVKAATCSLQKSQGIQKTSTKSSTSSSGSSAVQTKAEKTPQKKAKK